MDPAVQDAFHETLRVCASLQYHTPEGASEADDSLRFSRSARAPSRFIDHAAWGSLGKSSLERPVIGHEAPHAPLSSRIYILPRRSRRARALD